MKIYVHPRVHKFLEKQHSQVAARIKKRLKLLKNNPHHYLERLAGRPYFKYRISNYRAFVAIEGEWIVVFSIKHRRNAYKR